MHVLALCKDVHQHLTLENRQLHVGDDQNYSETQRPHCKPVSLKAKYQKQKGLRLIALLFSFLSYLLELGNVAHDDRHECYDIQEPDERVTVLV